MQVQGRVQEVQSSPQQRSLYMVRIQGKVQEAEVQDVWSGPNEG